MLTTATQQRNSQDNLQDNLQGNSQGNPQSKTPPISIETSPIAPIIDAATIFSLRFTARIKRISALLIMSALMVFLAACAGGGGGGGGAQSTDTDGDGVRNNVDVDADGDGLIEITTAQQLNQTRHNLQGSSLKINATDTGDANGCGNGRDITACNGYELTKDISLAGYADWQPIGNCPTYDPIVFACTDTATLFNATFHGNDRTISNLAITNSNSLYTNASGLFGAISRDSVLRNINIRSASINGSANGVGMLVGYAREATIRDSSVEGEIDVTGRIVGGLIGSGDDATITLSSAESGIVSGGAVVGGLVGSGARAIIISSFAKSGNVSGTREVGGLVGGGWLATITSSYADSENVHGNSEVSTNLNHSIGGLVGNGYNATITSSYAVSGTVSGGDRIGGLVGYGEEATVNSSYAVSMAVNGASELGGLVGQGNDNTAITASYWDDAVNISGATAGSYGSSKSTAELQAPAHATGIYATWSSLCPGINRPVWYFGNSTQYPVLTCHPNSDSDRDGVPDITDTDDDNDGTLDTADALPLNPTEDTDTDNDGVGDNADAFPSDPTESVDTDGDGVGDNVDVDADGDGLIEIATAQQLNQSRHNLLGSNFTRSAGGVGDANGCGNGGSVTECNGYELIADIYLTTYTNWQPIGRCMNYNSGLITCSPTTQFFNAIFDGNNHTINDLTITNHDGSYDNASGLFGAIHADSILRNIHIRSGNISDGGRNVGLLVGYAQGASIINSSAEGAVDASGNNVGGLVGDGRSARITSSYAVGGAVSGDGNNVGGLVGYGFESIITSSYAAGGDVSGTGNDVGGLVGDGDGATITSSYAAGGAVSGDRRVGGLVGDGGSSMTITSSYAAGGAVSGDGNSVGGLVGSANNGLGGAEITSSYAAGGAVSGGFDVGGLVGFGLYATITSSYAAGGDVSGTGNDVGGLVGDGLGAIITSSYAAGGAVSGGEEVGGLVGYGEGSTITSSYAAGGSVSGLSDVGGLVGDGSDANITASYWDDAVTIIPSTGNSYGSPQTTNELQTTRGTTGIYATWTGLCPGTSYPTWYFSDSTQYPILTCNRDSDGDGMLDIIDIDDDNDGILDTADDLPLNPTEDTDTDNDGVGNNTDAFPSDPNESVDTDGDRVGNNADNCPLVPNNGQDDFDNDMVGDACDIDTNGNGLIEIATAQQLNQSRHNLLGSSFKSSAGGVGNANGCGNGTTAGEDVTACNGYELIADIYLTTYTNWQPIGRCTTSAFDCTPENKLFNATFDGNSHTINDLTITNHDGSYDNAAGLFGAISSDSILRNIHIRSGNISDGGHNVGLLVGYAQGAMIINSSAEGAVNASGNNVGGLVGDGEGSTITSSYAAGGDVSGTGNDVGGLVGDGLGAIITSSYAAGGDVSGGDFVGGLVGGGRDSTITSSYAAGGAVSGTGSIGGLVGVGQQATIMSSYAAGGAVSGTNSVGGLVGLGERVTITSSYAAGGNVRGGIIVGGLVGFGRDSTITSSYAAGGAVSGEDFVGGLVGGGEPTEVTASYWDDAVTIIPSAGNSYGLPKTTSELQTPAHATGIYATWTSLCPGANKPAWYFGNSTQYPVLTCHPNSDSDRDGVPDIIDTDDDGDGTLDTADALPLNPTEDTDTDNDGVGNNTDAFPSDPNESANTDNDDIGDNADNCPLVPNNGQDDFDNDMVGDACDVDDNGNGLIEIATAQQLNQTRNNLQGSSFNISDTDAGDSAGCGGQDGITACNGYELTNDISLAEYANWLPIGRCVTPSTSICTPVNALFNATFDGNNHTINDLTITNPTSSYDNAAGLFGAISSDSILRNIHIRSANLIGGGANVGLLVGYAHGASIINSSAEGAVNTSGFDVGGLVGGGRFATITSSYAAGGAVSGAKRVGGLIGDGRFATITSSYAAGGNVSGTGNEVGGLVGWGQDANITSSYAAGGDVSGGFDVGGLVGQGASATITSSYAAGGAVSGTGNEVGGLVGSGDSANITSSYAAGGAINGDNDVGGLVGDGFNATITSSYAAGGAVSGDNDVGGLVGNGSDATITFSYWDSEKSGITVGSVVGESEGKTTQKLKMGADDIYSTWASDTCADGTTLTWNFGTASEYPALNCTPNGFLPQRRQR